MNLITDRREDTSVYKQHLSVSVLNTDGSVRERPRAVGNTRWDKH